MSKSKPNYVIGDIIRHRRKNTIAMVEAVGKDCVAVKNRLDYRNYDDWVWYQNQNVERGPRVHDDMMSDKLSGYVRLQDVVNSKEMRRDIDSIIEIVKHRGFPYGFEINPFSRPTETVDSSKWTTMFSYITNRQFVFFATISDAVAFKLQYSDLIKSYCGDLATLTK